MKRVSQFLAVILIVAGCAGTPPEADKPLPEAEYVIIDHKTRDFGGSTPDWVEMTPIQMEESGKYEDYYVFIDDQVGKDLEGIKLWARGFTISSEIARLVSTRVEDKFVGAAAGDKDALEGYLEEVVKSISEASYSGVRTEDEFWIKKRFNDGKEEYRYLFLVTVPRDQIEAAILRAFAEADERPETEEKKTAITRVKEAFEGGL
jgi:hypothetical protein